MVTYNSGMERIFKALSDPSRRKLLDRLREKDGQTLAQLCEGLPMTRYGVMKHLRLLGDAHLVITRRVGREKLHFLNPVPIQLIHDRWISKFAQTWVGAMGALKTALEEIMPSNLKHVYEVYVRSTPEKVWQALTNPEFTRQYFYGTAMATDLKPGSKYTMDSPDGSAAIQGEILEVVPNRKLVMTFNACHDTEAKSDRASRVTWEIRPYSGSVLIVLTHDDFDGETSTYKSVRLGWNPVLSGLKTLLETGEPLVIGSKA